MVEMRLLISEYNKTTEERRQHVPPKRRWILHNPFHILHITENFNLESRWYYNNSNNHHHQHTRSLTSRPSSPFSKQYLCLFDWRYPDVFRFNIKWMKQVTSNTSYFFQISLFHRAFRFTKFYLYQRKHLFLSYTKIT